MHSAWIRSRLRIRGASQADLAKAIGLSRDKLSKALSGRRLLKAEELQRIAAYLGESPPGFPPSPAGHPPDPHLEEAVDLLLRVPEGERGRAVAWLRRLVATGGGPPGPDGHESHGGHGGHDGPPHRPRKAG